MTKRSIFFFYRFPISRARLSRILSLSLSLHLRSQNGSTVYAFLTGTRLRVPNCDCVYITYEPLFPLSCHVPRSLLSLRLSSRFPASLLAVFLPSFPSYLLTLPSSLFRRTSISLNKLLRATPFFVDVHRKNVCVNLFAIIVLTESNQRSIGGIHLGEMFDWNFIMYR